MIPRRLVHKQAADEVLVTSVDAAADDVGGWWVRVRLPRGHVFHGDVTGRSAGFYDPLLIVEALRQGCIAIGHLGYGVPMDFHYTVRFYELSVLDMAALDFRSDHGEFDIRVLIGQEFRPAAGDAVTGLAVVAVASRDGVAALEVSGAFGWLPDDRWQLMRVGSTWEPGPQPVRAEPAAVGRTRSANVVIGEPVSHPDGAVHAPIVVDTGNRAFFDHPVDHLPGGLILEACRQLALAALGRRATEVTGLARLRCEFKAFAEMRPGCVVVLDPQQRPLTFRGEVNQSGRVCATIALEFR